MSDDSPNAEVTHAPRKTSGKFGSSEIYRAEWRDGPDVEKWLSQMSVGRTLNFPCGSMMWGDVRADIDPQHDPDVIADICNPPFDHREFGTVYVDPPYSMTAYDTIWDWVLGVWEIVDRRMIINMPNIRVAISDADYRLFIEHRPPTPAMTLYHVFDRHDAQLGEFFE